MTSVEHFDVVIVGAGLVGSAMACALAADARGAALSIAVVEAGQEPRQYRGAEFDPRVVALTHASHELLDSVGAWALIQQQRACPYTDMEVWDAEGTGSIHFDCREVQQPCLGHIVENSVISQALLQRLAAYPQITLLRPARVKHVLRLEDHSGIEILLEDGRHLSGALLLAADGANSKIRELANMPTREWNYGHHAIVTTVRTEMPHQFTAWQRFLPTGPLAFLPLQTEADDRLQVNYSSIVWSVNNERAPELMALSDDEFARELGRAFEHRLGQVTDVAQRFAFPLRQRHAIDYIQEGIALLGDAAHTVHPLAGQGVNLGFLDVGAMRDEILRACQRQLPLTDPSILKRYQRARKSHNLAMMGVMEGFKRLFGADHLQVRWLRNEGMRRLNSLPMLKNAVVKQAMGL
ncbi:UbiH/UbiF/VisC/COQ6 family ubiquinone biosynthesis hydroxylase [Aestuariicella hydrocarbonica]|uniref:UbiH/UbiF/VisC/COQ6 family ubiquinone biosynthesis hydroxylase n=1 Tax=Pseudomaricurvus hydrocarbonicus TaxID=1470433 RepID=A0A9E5MNM3_9GAMM|nr:UbiH/UbiF/VisC/COQ6 family ubiquinone biosynthesis hydroxylase [Aestuariicella hydrocarbonica]NHO67601.1 UbiH/UbiF/VisC/COQ6 family ubiquinone biosynthesis hydroxylase [Aestuariicella hydrocarbonica]